MGKKELLRLIKLKTYLLCYGIRENKYSKEFYSIQNPYDIKKGGYVGLHFLLNGQIPTLASTTNKFDKRSKFEMKKQGEKFFLASEDEKILITPLKMPSWYLKKTSAGKPLSSVFAYEGLHYLHQQYSGCAFQAAGVGCKFCGIGCKWLDNSAEEVAETAIKACDTDPNYQVCLGGGTRLDPSKGVNFFLDIVKSIRAKNKTAPIWIEMIPPDTNEQIAELIDAGASAFNFNLEIWDDGLRKKICPGKSRISKERYFEAWRFVQEHLDKDKAGTALISSLEPSDSTLKGIREISKEQVRITLLPFKPWDGSEYEKKEPTNPEKHFELAFELAREMKKYNIEPSKNYGCANCESCTVEDDILKYVL